jgi:hypothetical protein
MEIEGTEVGDIELNGSIIYRDVRVCKRNQVRTPATCLDGYYKLDSPIVVRVDNIGAIFMGANISISQRTKHVDVRAKFVTEMIAEGILKVIFVRS